MYLKISLAIIVSLIAVSLQVGFISALPGWFNQFELIVVILVFLSVMIDWRIALGWALGIGLILDSYTYAWYGQQLFGLAAVVGVSWFLGKNFFTNRSLYSFFALTFFASIVYRLTGIVFTEVSGFLSGGIFLEFGRGFWLAQLSGVLANMAGAAGMFFIINTASKRFRPVFLVRK